MTTARDLGTFRQLAQTSGLAAALAYLNDGVPHRYTAIYRLEQGQFRNVCLHDKQGEAIPQFLATIPFEASFCQYVLRDRPFSTNDSIADPRLNGHPYQGVIAAYHGIPLFDDEGDIVGTLGHFDTTAHEISDAEFALLQAAARAVPNALVHGTPDPTPWA